MFKGFGAQNYNEGNVKGSVAKNVVYQACGKFCMGLARASKRLVSGPNPCKLVAIALQKRHCSSKDHKKFYRDILAGFSGVYVQYAGCEERGSGKAEL